MNLTTSPHRLLVEPVDFEALDYIIEEKNKDAPSSMFFKGPYLMAEKSNKNGRIYGLNEMVNEVNRYNNEMVKMNRAMGELNHPQSADINLERACHMVTELRQEGNIFVGKSKVLSTPMGQLTRQLVMDGVKLGVSSRSLGKLIPEGNNSRVQNMRLIAVDCVADPSVPTAFVNGILESKGYIVNHDGSYEEVYERFESKISTLPKHSKDDYLRAQILDFIKALKNK